MNLIICLDEGHGYSFFGRRQSMDRALRNRALELTAGGPLYMDAYSAGQFRENAHRIRVVAEPARDVPETGWFFLELGNPEALLPLVNRLAVFRWNREYPSDKRFPLQEIREKAALCYREDFPGHSHERIDLEVYQL